MPLSTLRGVAARAGVSIGLASAVINRSAAVSDDARRRVLEAVEALGYVPHAGARSLRVGRTGLVGLVLPDITNPHFSGLAHAVEGACDQAGLMLTLCITSDDPDKEQRQLRLLAQQRAEGVILVPGARSAGEAERLRATVSSALVLLDRRIDGLDADAVLLDNHAAAAELTGHLLSLGHRRIGIVCGPPEVDLARERLEGFRAAFQHPGIAVAEDLVAMGGFQAGPAFDATLRLLDLPHRPTAFVSTSNHTTVGLITALQHRGLRCPEDVSLAAIDDFTWADAFSPRLTVAAQPVAAMGRAAVRCLLERLGGERGEHRVLRFPAKIVVRGSTRAA